MNSKGFTMVELIAVVAIITILSGVTIGAVTRQMEKAKRKTYKTHETNLKRATNNFLSKHTELASGSTLRVSAQDLIKEGFLDDMGDPVNKGETCNRDSYVEVTGSYDNSLDEHAYNINFDFKICLICKSYKSAGC